MAIIGQDHFTGSDGTQLVDHVPDVGNHWIWSGGPEPSLTVQLNSNRLAYNTAYGSDYLPYYLDIDDIANCYVQAVLKELSPICIALYARINLATWDKISLYPTSGFPETAWILSDGVVDIGCHPSYLHSGDIVKLVVNGVTASAYFNGVLAGSLTTSLLTGKVGLSMKNVAV